MRRVLLPLGAMIAALLAINVASASAQVHWSNETQGIKVSGSVNLYKNGLEPRTCTADSNAGEMGPGWAWLKWGPEVEYLRFSCIGGGALQMLFLISTPSTTSVEVHASAAEYQSPFGTYQQAKMVVPFTNGSGSTASKITFNNTKLGTVTGLCCKTLTLSGSLKVTTSSGGLLTLLP
jgi:hypothetical protein